MSKGVLLALNELIDTSPASNPVNRLRDALAAQAQRVIDLFRKWDVVRARAPFYFSSRPVEGVVVGARLSEAARTAAGRALLRVCCALYAMKRNR